MTIKGEVVGLRTDDTAVQPWVRVTISLWGSGTLELRVRRHEARGYKLGRVVKLTVGLTDVVCGEKGRAK
jgi:hypothetical protein